MSIPILKQGSYLIASIQSSPSDSEWREMGKILADRVGKFRSRGVVIDVTVLDLIDSFAARTLREIAKAERRSLSAQIAKMLAEAVAWRVATNKETPP